MEEKDLLQQSRKQVLGMGEEYNSEMEGAADDITDIDDISSLLDMIEELVDESDSRRVKPKKKTASENGNPEIEDYREQGFSEAQLYEISLGMYAGLQTDRYAKECYNWKQMHEIRIGLMENLETAIYEDSFYSAEQMREIRIGMHDMVDITKYATVVNSAADMRRERKRLTTERYKRDNTGYERVIYDESSMLEIRISNDYMEAFIRAPKDTDRIYSVPEIIKVLKKHDIRVGILKNNIEIMAANAASGKEFIVAEGVKPLEGRDGWYEMFVKKNLLGAPVELDDGSVDYSSVVAEDSIEPGQVLALYHPAECGRNGYTVTGIIVEGEPGKELPELTGNGISYNAARREYTAVEKGCAYYDLEEGTLNVWKVYTINGDANRYNGNISYDGVICVTGSVKEMTQIKAAGDIIVDGFVEGAFLEAGQNIILKSGVNAGGKGRIVAGGRIMGDFFEAANLKAEGSIEGNYFLDCRVETEDKLICSGNKSKIMGGDITARGGIDVVNVVNYGNAKAALRIGNKRDIEASIEALRQERQILEEENNKLITVRDKLIAKAGEEAIQSNEMYLKACKVIQEKKLKLKECDEELERLYEKVKKAEKACVRITGKAELDVVVYINENIRKIGEKTFNVVIQ